METLFTENNPMTLFEEWFSAAQELNYKEPAATTFSTVGLNGFPNSRVLLLKKWDQEGFYFFTNYNSQKGKELEASPNVCLNFYWDLMTPPRQLKIFGVAEKASYEISSTYWKTRPRGSQESQLASKQSETVASKEAMLRDLESVKTEYEGKEIPCPKHWGGYLIRPKYFEFWYADPNRFHDRITFTKDGDSWKKQRIYP